MTGILGILESSATQGYQDVNPTQEFFFHRHIYSLWVSVGHVGLNCGVKERTEKFRIYTSCTDCSTVASVVFGF